MSALQISLAHVSCLNCRSHRRGDNSHKMHRGTGVSAGCQRGGEWYEPGTRTRRHTLGARPVNASVQGRTR